MSAQVFKDKSVDAALEQAARALGVTVDELEHELVDERADDFWGLGDTVYSVRAWRRDAEPPTAGLEDSAGVEVGGEPELTESAETAVVADQAPSVAPTKSAYRAAGGEGPERGAGDLEPTAYAAAVEGDLPAFFRVADSAPAEAPAEVEEVAATAPLEAPAGAPSEDQPEAAAVESGERGESDEGGAPRNGVTDVSDEATDLLDTIFETLGFDCEAEARLDGETLQIAITGDDNQYLLDGRGRGLSALELILNHAFRHRPDRAHRRVRVDAGDFRSQRDDEIRDMAYQVAHQAKEMDSPQQTSPLNPYERRIVHLTLAEDPKVETRSIGTGFQKAVNVIPITRGRRR